LPTVVLDGFVYFLYAPQSPRLDPRKGLLSLFQTIVVPTDFIVGQFVQRLTGVINTRVVLDVSAQAGVAEESFRTGAGTEHLRGFVSTKATEGVRRVHIITSISLLRKPRYLDY